MQPPEDRGLAPIGAFTRIARVRDAVVVKRR